MKKLASPRPCGFPVLKSTLKFAVWLFTANIFRRLQPQHVILQSELKQHRRRTQIGLPRAPLQLLFAILIRSSLSIFT